MEKPEREPQEGGVVIGPLTYTDLSQSACFCAPPQVDEFSVLRAPFTRQLARMSAELAADIYDLRVSRWIQAGYSDMTFLVEDKIVALDRETHSRLAAIEAEWKRRRARARLQSSRPFGDLLRTARQLFVTDMGKGVVMTRTLPDGRAVIAISFIGTTQKLFDWMTNFKFQSTDGMHHGFLMLARYFESQAERILLPSLALALGRERLTLAEAIGEAARGEGGLLFWLSGHSQGGALVQLFARLLLARGVKPEQIMGYSFAAPTVALAGAVSHPHAFPVYNIISADDIVPRVGAQIRLGVDCVFHPDEAFDRAHYRIEPEKRAAFERMMFIGRQVRSTEDALCLGLSLMRLLSEAGPRTDMRVLFSQVIPFLALSKRFGFGPAEMAAYISGKLAEHHQCLSEAAPDQALVEHYEGYLRSHIGEFGPREAAASLRQTLAAPHLIRPDDREEGLIPPYIAIARRHLDMLERCVWMEGKPALCVDACGEPILPPYKPRGLSAIGK